MNADRRSTDELTAEANLVRSKLLDTVEELDRRRHDAFDLNAQAKKHIVLVAAAAGAIVITSGTVVGLVTYRLATRSERKRRARWGIFRALWDHPERATKRSPPLAERIARSVLVGLASAAILIPLRMVVTRALTRALPPAPH